MPALRFIGFSVVRAWQGFWRNAMMSLAATATVILMLVLLAALFIVISGLNSGIEFIESKVGVTAELARRLPIPERNALLDEIAALPNVSEVRYVSVDEAVERLEESYEARGQTLDTGGTTFCQEISPPGADCIELPATFEIALTDPGAARDVASALGAFNDIARVTTKQETIDRLLGVINIIRTVGIVAVGLVALTVLFMIINTIRIAVYSRANEIEIMRLVGASDSFIRWPFILEGILCGLIGAVITVVLVAMVWDPIQPAMVQVFQMPTAVSARFLATLSLLLFGVGLGVGALGSWISVRSYLSATT
jgi:cell division transport system permease protein